MGAALSSCVRIPTYRVPEPGRPVGLQIDPACLLQFDGAGMRQRHAEQIEAAA